MTIAWSTGLTTNAGVHPVARYEPAAAPAAAASGASRCSVTSIIHYLGIAVT
ncbi:hypothetical protein [Halorubrum sp. Atlit-28R]|uniref:hypothetical protein n=1 Tax=Halorubrum sp. Atlit-28R TaxID=2282129 RepID=UPI000A8C0466|nr:hypothetical protein [Halorubrum sp. Atlit-28R]